jgi:hypothetical protein
VKLAGISALLIVAIVLAVACGEPSSRIEFLVPVVLLGGSLIFCGEGDRQRTVVAVAW